MLIDTHCHLTDERYDGGKEIVARMQEDGLEKLITVAYDLPSSYRCVQIAEQNENVYATVGVHPSDSCRLSDDPCNELLALCSHPKVVAYGEIGLDYHYGDDKQIQKKWLDKQLSLVGKSALPVSFHIREAYQDTFDLVKAHKADIQNGGVLHCYSGSYEYAKPYLDMGFYVSFSGVITFKNAGRLLDVVRALPLDRILIETDSPYMTPVPHRGKLNQPAFVKYQAEKIAELVGKTTEEIEAITTRNAYNAFPKLK